jgi:hypothetical protein
MKLIQLVHKTDLNQSVLKKHLDFLIQQDFVEEQNLGKDEIFYAITGRSLKVLDIVAPKIEGAHKISPLLY